ncbi:MAG: response regulator [Bacillus sp. (in: firmicutes)]
MISVLLIEDDPMVREVNRQFIERVKGSKVIGFAANGAEGLEKIRILRPDLVFMDIFMPEQDGVATLHKLREQSIQVDVIAVTAANDMKTIQQVLQLGAFDYIMKPFKFERIKQSLENYYTYRQKIVSEQEITQKELDQILYFNQSEQKEPSIDGLPKGLNAVTLEKIVSYIHNQISPISAEAVAHGVGLARVTARRYLDYLEKQHKVKIVIQYGGVGRPINQYIKVDETK